MITWNKLQDKISGKGLNKLKNMKEKHKDNNNKTKKITISNMRNRKY
jgi:hypothetical protein